MKRQDLENLLGGYSAGTLTPDEEQLLFAAALEDQELFDALAREQPLRDLLQDPAARARLLAALADQPLPWYRRMAAWAVQPRVLASFAGLFCMVTTLTVWEMRHRREAPVLTAQVAPAAPAFVPAPAPVAEAAPPPALPKPQARTVIMPKPEPKPVRRAEAAGSLQLAENLPVRKEQQRDLGRLTAGAAGFIGGVPQTAGQLTAPAAPALQADSQVLPAPSAAPIAPAPPPPGRAIQSLLELAPAAKAAPTVAPLRWTVFRRQPGEEFVAGNAANLQAGDEVKLRVESNLAGYVYVVESQAPLVSSHLDPGQSFETAIAPQGPGRRDLNLWFSAQPMTWPQAGAARPAFFSAGSGGAKAQPPAGGGNGTGALTPASNQTGTPPPVHNVITLNYQ